MIQIFPVRFTGPDETGISETLEPCPLEQAEMIGVYLTTSAGTVMLQDFGSIHQAREWAFDAASRHGVGVEDCSTQAFAMLGLTEESIQSLVNSAALFPDTVAAMKRMLASLTTPKSVLLEGIGAQNLQEALHLFGLRWPLPAVNFRSLTLKDWHRKNIPFGKARWEWLKKEGWTL